MLRNFVLCAMTAGFAGILEGVRTSSITPDPSGSNQFLLYAVAAVIIGGTVMTGGEGTVVGAMLGALFIGVLQDGLVLKSVNANYEYLYLGIAIIIAMTIYVLVQARAKGDGSVPEVAYAGEQIVGLDTADDDVLRVEHISQAVRTDGRAARHQPAPAQGRGAGAARRQRRRQVDADQDPVGLSPSRTRARCGARARRTRRSRSSRRAGAGSTRSSRIWR